MKYDLVAFRNALVVDYNKHLYAAQSLKRNGEVPYHDKVIYSCEVTMTKVLGEIIEALDASKVE
jgi:hypothetical protein